MQRKKILLVTNSYPEIGSKEKSFIHAELLELVRIGFDVTIMPIRFNGSVDPEVPQEVVVSSVLSSSYRKLQPFTMLNLFFYLDFWKEIIKKPLLLSRFRFWKDSFRAVISAKLFRTMRDRYDVFYTYWFSGETTGLVFSGVTPIVTRAHGYDLYLERAENAGWIPYRRKDLTRIRYVILLSGKARDYLERVYRFPPCKALISPLGVENRSPAKFDVSSIDREIVFFSCSFAAAVKRLPRILEFVTKYAEFHPEVMVRWIHIGANLADVDSDATKIEFPKNFAIDMKGALPNAVVLEFMKSENVTFFVNLSEMEGLPVSIMEAQSLGIPAIATDVGCVSDLIEEGGGVLVSPEIDAVELVSIVSSIARDRILYMKMREIAYCTQRNKYNGKENHANLAKSLFLSLA